MPLVGLPVPIQPILEESELQIACDRYPNQNEPFAEIIFLNKEQLFVSYDKLFWTLVLNYWIL